MVLGVAVWAQTFGEITGKVRDASGVVVAGAPVTITNLATGGERKATTNDAGLYSFPALPPASTT
ncbi:MAG: carboxypeptidase regulatory-like domain-containing protein [Acidobacteria bacterium]|nr:carboxypeptidase regulatory-like domain-containing protein [Acidobacteriota bacterium]